MVAVTHDTTIALDENATLPGILEQQPSFSDSNSSNNNNSNVENGNGTTMQYTNIEDSLNNKSIENDNKIENDSRGTINSIENDDSDNENGNSYWDVLITLYLPVLFLWFRRSMFGFANLIRSIVVGQLMRLVFMDNFFEWISERLHLPPWLQVLLFQSSSAISTTCTGNSSSSASSTILGACAGSGKLDPHAWPPPAFTALALFTIFALVVHPDGITWIVLGKFRFVFGFGQSFPCSALFLPLLSYFSYRIYEFLCFVRSKIINSFLFFTQMYNAKQQQRRDIDRIIYPWSMLGISGE